MSERFKVNKLGFRYYAVHDTQAGRNVRTMCGDASAQERAESAAAELNAQDAIDKAAA